MFDHDTWEVLSYVVTVFGLPMAILVFVWEQRRDRQQEEEEIYQQLSDEYTSFMKLVLENADLRLLQRSGPSPILTDLLVYEPDMSLHTARMWQSWEDFMREWCRRPEFRAELPVLLNGEDPDFATHISAIAADEAAAAKTEATT